MAKRYLVSLTKEERERLLLFLKRGKISARKLCRVQILLQADTGASDTAIATAVHVDVRTVERLRKRFVEEGLEAALQERRRPGRTPKLDGRQEAFLIALACSAAPQGHERWTLHLLAARLVEVGLVESISDDTVGRVLKKTPSTPGSNTNGVFRPWMPNLSGGWKTCWISMPSPMMDASRWSALTSVPTSWWGKFRCRCLRARANRPGMIISIPPA